ncbi:hypothetical protein ACWT_1189 [Actinoplanes sp. SE50]|nr:hypothetical protein ACPL_1308 [Actinoplanes sp. SE50/110]ATO80604.1 hypothetical protein ACWT_1189 [Actinoplanes sp. SE50]SLL98010.1 hypothetical protein ACSP50_1227 [Actinoplanes sp. SE50/110]
MVIATVLLTIIGMIGGYLLSERRDARGTARPSASATTDASDGPSLLPTEGLCPDQTQEMGHRNGATGDLLQVFRVTTERKTVIWICQDDRGRLFYHANRGGTAAPWKEGVTALFLAGVTRQDDGSFQAVAPQDGNTFSINRERLLVTKSDGTEAEQRVVGD